MYYPFLIVLETMTLYSDAALMKYLLGAFSVKLWKLTGKKDRDEGCRAVLLQIISWSLLFLAAAGPVAFIYYLVSHRIMPEDTKKVFEGANGTRFKLLTGYQEITLAYYIIYLCAAILFTWIAGFNLHTWRRFSVPSTSLRIGLPILAGCLVARSIVQLFFAAAYKYKPHVETDLAKLFHLLFYGFLSVAIYYNIAWISRSDEWTSEDGIQKETDDTINTSDLYIQSGHQSNSIGSYPAQQSVYNTYPAQPPMYHNH
jgi:hypothetical protein